MHGSLKFAIKIVRYSPLNIPNLSGIKLLTRLRLGLSHLNEHKFNDKFDDCVNPFFTCSFEPGSTSHFFLHWHHYNTVRSILFKDLNSVDKNLFKLSDNELTLILLYVSTQYSLMDQHDLTPRIYVLHKITIALKFMCYINQKLRPSYQTVLNLCLT